MNADRPLVMKPPRKPKPLPQSSGPEDVMRVAGEDAAPIRWAGAMPCGHRIPAQVGPPPVATFLDPDEPPRIESSPTFVVVLAEPGECPRCDDAQRMAVRDEWRP